MLGPEEFASGLGIGLKSFFGGTVGEPERGERGGGRERELLFSPCT